LRALENGKMGNIDKQNIKFFGFGKGLILHLKDFHQFFGL
jgi:hypothetical protein